MSAAPAAGGDPSLAERVFDALADGELHSGEQLAGRERVSRSAIWKAVGVLQQLGVAIDSTPHRGYRLRTANAPLAARAIRAALPAGLQQVLRACEVVWSVPSTNSALLARGEVPPGRFDLLVAEHQSAGRGRRARQWYAPPGGALCLSLSWTYAALPPGAAALSLAVGVCVLRALTALGSLPVRLKWPNDVVVADRKLGGILIELRAESAGPALVVVGVGLNCALGDALIERVRATGTDPTDLASLGIAGCDRNALAAELTCQLVRGVAEFEHGGLAAFANEWAAADALQGRDVVVCAAGREYIGTARGIDAAGALRVEGEQGIMSFNSGEVTVRARA